MQENRVKFPMEYYFRLERLSPYFLAPCNKVIIMSPKNDLWRSPTEQKQW